jgi:hypothetical protein
MFTVPYCTSQLSTRQLLLDFFLRFARDDVLCKWTLGCVCSYTGPIIAFGRIRCMFCLFYTSDVCIRINIYACLLVHNTFFYVYLYFSNLFLYSYLRTISLYSLSDSFSLISHPLHLSLPLLFAVAKICSLKHFPFFCLHYDDLNKVETRRMYIYIYRSHPRLLGL